MSIVFIYKKQKEIKVFSYGETTILEHKYLKDDGWEHIQTINCEMFFKEIFKLNDKERRQILKDLFKE